MQNQVFQEYIKMRLSEVRNLKLFEMTKKQNFRAIGHIFATALVFNAKIAHLLFDFIFHHVVEGTLLCRGLLAAAPKDEDDFLF